MNERNKILTDWGKPILMGVVTGIIVMLVGVAVLSYFVFDGKLDDTGVTYAMTGVLLAAAMSASGLGLRKVKEKRLMVSALIGAALYAVMIVFNILLFGEGISGALVTGLIVIGVSAATGILSNTTKKTLRSKRIKF